MRERRLVHHGRIRLDACNRTPRDVERAANLDPSERDPTQPGDAPFDLGREVVNHHVTAIGVGTSEERRERASSLREMLLLRLRPRPREPGTSLEARDRLADRVVRAGSEHGLVLRARLGELGGLTVRRDEEGRDVRLPSDVEDVGASPRERHARGLVDEGARKPLPDRRVERVVQDDDEAIVMRSGGDVA